MLHVRKVPLIVKDSFASDWEAICWLLLVQNVRDGFSIPLVQVGGLKANVRGAPHWSPNATTNAGVKGSLHPENQSDHMPSAPDPPRCPRSLSTLVCWKEELMSNHSISSATELTTTASFPDHHEQRQQFFFSFWGAVLSNAAMLCKFMIIRV